nr:aminodeoxychorismate synthase component I [Ectothiorhodospira marina]
MSPTVRPSDVISEDPHAIMPTRSTGFRLERLPYPGDGARLFQVLAHRPWSVFLDSGGTIGGRSRFDILAADPFVTVVTRGGVTRIGARDGLWESTADPLQLLARRLGPRLPPVEGLPFAGGALGYFAYDLARRFERLPSIAHDGENLPEMAVGLHDWAVVVDHQEQLAWLVGRGLDPHTARIWPDLLRMLSKAGRGRVRSGFRLSDGIQSNMSREDYQARFARVQHFIREGDCYQVNLAQRFSASAQGNAWGSYQRLRHISPAPFGAFLKLPEANILSNSPERFLEVRAGQVSTRPIKGTRPRGTTRSADQVQREQLAASPKDRAENVMIVDLLRNDLGKACTTGSVKVPELFSVESYATVHHLVSAVSGQLAAGRDALDLLRGCFPGGSITGAPKLRAMEIIETLEPHRRGVYCGAIGYVGFEGDMDTSIAIRTLVNSHGQVRFWAGGGITSGSQGEDEYQETLHKASAMMSLLRRRTGE